jgi:hypothetical protein
VGILSSVRFDGVKVPLLLITVFIIIMILVKNSHVLQRFMVNQEIRLSTSQYEVTSTEHFDVKYLPIDEAYAPMVAAVAEDARQSVSGMFGEQPPERTTLIIYPDSASLAKSFGWNKNAKAMGVYWGGSIRVLSPGEWLKEPSQEAFIREGPVYHEYAHLMVDEVTEGNYSRWLTEGIAQYVEKHLTGFEFASPAVRNREVTLYSLRQLDKDFDSLEESVAYWQSLQIVEYIVDHYGEAAIWQILNDLGDGYQIDGTVEKTLGLSYERFEDEMLTALEKEWIRGCKV